MKGDFTRRTFRSGNHYRGVLMQQGRVQLDADWNEQLDIQLHHDETTARDVIGSHGGPQDEAGFAITDLKGGEPRACLPTDLLLAPSSTACRASPPLAGASVVPSSSAPGTRGFWLLGTLVVPSPAGGVAVSVRLAIRALFFSPVVTSRTTTACPPPLAKKSRTAKLTVLPFHKPPKTRS